MGKNLNNMNLGCTLIIRERERENTIFSSSIYTNLSKTNLMTLVDRLLMMADALR